MSLNSLFEDMKTYRTPQRKITYAVPVSPGEIPLTNFDFRGVEWKTPVPMACGCHTTLGMINAFERYMLRYHKYSHYGTQAENDFLLTLVCGKCAKQVSEPFSAWSIARYHGCANWVAQNASKTF